MFFSNVPDPVSKRMSELVGRQSGVVRPQGCECTSVLGSLRDSCIYNHTQKLPNIMDVQGVSLPALLTRTSSLAPRSSPAAAAQSRHPAGEDRSLESRCALPTRTRALVRCSSKQSGGMLLRAFSMLRLTRTTCAPPSRNLSAMLRPMPWLAPVTRTFILLPGVLAASPPAFGFPSLAFGPPGFSADDGPASSPPIAFTTAFLSVSDGTP
mmetsp:Transcript_13996/g.39602  ORF Transcript_13996/g.39602 Transcript_13996/m.39602 type:complete len:210 (+) Transcript_13996:811-1440(+)